MSFFTVIIPTYNRAGHLIQAIESVQGQINDDWELIVVDDGSTDDTKNLVTQIDDVRVRYIYQENAERSAARNNGIKHAKGDWICFLDSDDYFLPDHLSSFYNFIKENSLAEGFLVSGGYKEVNGVQIKNPIFHGDGSIHPAQFILANTSITPINTCISKNYLLEHNFVERYKKSYWEDTHLWIRLSIFGKFYQLDNFTSVLAEHPNRSVNSIVKMERVNDHINMIRHLFDNYHALVSPVLSAKVKRQYIDRKYRLFLYLSRQNKQLLVSLGILTRAFFNSPSFYLISEFPKIFLNKLGLGIHDS